jgi:N-methylhydantoinase A/oxoprolinase/acetone carboxylase beta subunit
LWSLPGTNRYVHGFIATQAVGASTELERAIPEAADRRLSAKATTHSVDDICHWGTLVEFGDSTGSAPDFLERGRRGAADLRYRGQSSELTVEIDLDNLSTDELDKAVARFEMEFEKTFGHLGRQREFELVTLRMVMTIARRVEHGETWRGETQSRKREPARKIYLGRDLGLVDARVVARRDLAPAAIRGPCLVEEYDTTIVVPPDWTASLDEWGNVLMENT